MESRLETAFQPGRYIEDRACFDFVHDLEEVLASIDDLAARDPKRAAALYELVLAGCHHKADQLEDSSGYFGMFAKEVICRWIRARQKSAEDPAATVTTLLSWIDDDPYAFCYEIEKDLCEAFDQSGIAAFEAAIRARHAAAPVPRDFDSRRWSQTLRAIYIARRDAAQYQKLAEETGVTAEDCLALARLFATKKPELSLEWVERGLLPENQGRYSIAAYDLKRLHRELLVKMGRPAQAWESAWKDYLKHSSKYSLDELLQLVPKEKQSEWRERALDAANVTDLQSAMSLFVETEAWDRLVRLVESVTSDALQRVSHSITEPAAKKLEESHPALAARLWRAQAFRIVEPGKSKYYDAAIGNLERAKRCFERAGLAAEWDATVAGIRRTHFRKLGFMRDFEVVARGESVERPSFLDSAKAKWQGKGKK